MIVRPLSSFSVHKTDLKWDAVSTSVKSWLLNVYIPVPILMLPVCLLSLRRKTFGLYPKLSILTVIWGPVGQELYLTFLYMPPA